MTKHFPIKFHPEIFEILGEQLVSDPVIAIQELVKNSYDADSPSCAVIIDTKKSRIVIKDYGHGMNEDAIKNGWLNVGTPLKRISDKSKSGNRYLTGSKGVGRLSAFSLGNVVKVTTTAEDKITRKFELRLKKILSLSSFDNYLVDVYETKSITRTCTLIKISNIKFKPDINFYNRLIRKLSILVVPKMKNLFKIFVKYDDKKVRLDPDVQLGACPIHIKTVVDKSGIVTINIIGNKNLYLGKKDLSHKIKYLLKKIPYLKNVELDIRWYLHGSRERVTMWKDAPSDFSKDMREGLSGIRIYRDGIRVLPYGETEDDTFNIEKKYISEGSKAKRPRKVQLMGWIYISRKFNPKLIDTSNREGLINNTAFNELYELVQNIIDEFMVYRRNVEAVPKEKKLNISDTKIVRTQIKKVKQQATLLTLDSKKLPKNVTTETIQKKITENMNKLEDYVEKVEDLLDVNALYRDRITAGNMINNILHYVGAATNSQINYINLASKELCDKKSHQISFEQMLDLLPRIKAAYDVLKGGSTGVGKIATFNVLEKTKPLVSNLLITSSMKPNQVVLNCNSFDVHMRESDFWAIIANLLLNAITCHDYEQGDNIVFPSKQEREIILTITKLNRNLIIQCEDNGPGLPDKPLDWIWQQFNSTRTPAGSGLGLFIISEIVTFYGGMKYASSSSRFKTGAYFYIQLNDVIA